MKPRNIGKSRSFRRGNQTETLIEISGVSVSEGREKAAGKAALIVTPIFQHSCRFGLGFEHVSKIQ
jgi:hypothetical protein